MTRRLVVLNVVGLTEEVVASTTRIKAFRDRHSGVPILPVFPAVTCSAQSTYLTGLPPSGHGVVANGWHNRELAETHFWKQSNRLVHGRKIWEELRELVPGFTCAKLFWWFNMYSSADYAITPRPMYPADGRKFFDIYSWPYSIRPEIKGDLGEFPFHGFWGPGAGVATPQGGRTSATDWIADSAVWIEKRFSPTLNLVYLPHLDYNLQRHGPRDPRVRQDYREIDAIVGRLVDFFESRQVDVINRPIHLNRLFREEHWLTVKDELGLELLDAGASKVFAVADHQIAHIYVNEPGLLSRVRGLLEKTPGVGAVLGPVEKARLGIDHSRSGDLVAVAEEDAWFTYYYWLDDRRAPDFARCVDIHRKPGYDPVELFIDPALKFPKLKILARLAQKKLGFRMLMDVIPLDASLVRGSHGARPARLSDYPVYISSRPEFTPRGEMQPGDVYHAIRRHLV
jgi:predicted AlkP superfamily pyrophosphatase or phosphodiesterase